MSVNTRLFSRTSDWCSALVWKHSALLTVSTAPGSCEAGAVFCCYLVGFRRLAERMLLVLFGAMRRCSRLSIQSIQAADLQRGRFKMESDQET